MTKTLMYYGENPHKTLTLYGITEAPKGTLDLTAAVVHAATPQECTKAPTEHCIVLRTGDRETMFAAR